MSEEIFRKKSLDRIKSPDDLDDYLRVTNGGLWLLIAAIAALLVGVCVWSTFGHIDSTVSAVVNVSGGEMTCYISEADGTRVEEGMRVTAQKAEGTVISVGGSDSNGTSLVIELDEALPDGIYTASIVTQTHRPISFVLN